jgi:hypothetical protein
VAVRDELTDECGEEAELAALYSAGQDRRLTAGRHVPQDALQQADALAHHVAVRIVALVVVQLALLERNGAVPQMHPR